MKHVCRVKRLQAHPLNLALLLRPKDCNVFPVPCYLSSLSSLFRKRLWSGFSCQVGVFEKLVDGCGFLHRPRLHLDLLHRGGRLHRLRRCLRDGLRHVQVGAEVVRAALAVEILPRIPQASEDRSKRLRWCVGAKLEY